MAEDKYYKNLKDLKSNINTFLEIAECDHAQMLGRQAELDRAANIFLSIETFFMDIEHNKLNDEEIVAKREYLLEEIREYLYS